MFPFKSVSTGSFCSLYVLRISTAAFGSAVEVVVVVTVVVVKASVVVDFEVVISEVQEVVGMSDSVVDCLVVDMDSIGVVEIAVVSDTRLTHH